jgi:hypothetical protein
MNGLTQNTSVLRLVTPSSGPSGPVSNARVIELDVIQPPPCSGRG